MPLLRITYQRGALTEAQKFKLAEEVAPVLVAGEVGADNPAGRAAATIISGAKPSRHAYDWKDERTPVMTYISPRDLIELFDGAVRGVAIRFGGAPAHRLGAFPAGGDCSPPRPAAVPQRGRGAQQDV